MLQNKPRVLLVLFCDQTRKQGNTVTIIEEHAVEKLTFIVLVKLTASFQTFANLGQFSLVNEYF